MKRHEILLLLLPTCLFGRKLSLLFSFCFQFEAYIGYFSYLPQQISQKKLEREHSHHQCSEYTAAGIKFGPASLSEYQYLCSSNGNKNDFQRDALIRVSEYPILLLFRTICSNYLTKGQIFSIFQTEFNFKCEF